jgi:hypothetical protein
MISKVSTPVSVEVFYDHQKRKNFIRSIFWQGKVYPILVDGFYHHFRKGKTLIHVFSVAGKNLSFRLSLNSESLVWTLEEVYADC